MSKRSIESRLRKLEDTFAAMKDENITFKVFKGETLTKIITWNTAGEVVYKWEKGKQKRSKKRQE